MTQNPNLAALSAAGVSVWLDDLSRQRLQSGNLQELIDTRSIVGVTTNPSIFQKALAEGDAYDAQVAELAERGADVDATIRTVTTDDVRNACDVLTAAVGGLRRCRRPSVDRGRPAAGARHRQDRSSRPSSCGRSSTGQPVHQDPGHQGGPARHHLDSGRGHFGQRHADLLRRTSPRGDGRLPGRARAAKAAGHDLSKIHSVASFFVSRVDTEIDKRLEKIGSDDAKACAARPVLPTPALLTRPTRKCSSAAIVSHRSRLTGHGYSGRCGHRPA